eukprot:6336453-Karenia_brevis.AAC.1
MTTHTRLAAYNCYAFSKLLYKLQILPYPTDALQYQRRFIHGMFKLPPSSLRDVDTFSLSKLGFNVHILQTTSLAAKT